MVFTKITNPDFPRLQMVSLNLGYIGQTRRQLTAMLHEYRRKVKIKRFLLRQLHLIVGLTIILILQRHV